MMETVTSADDASQLSSDPGHGTPDPDGPRSEEPGVGVNEVLGTEGAAEGQPPGVSESFLGLLRALGRALAVLSRPRVAGVLIGGLGVLIILLLGYIYVFTPLSAARSQHTLLQQIQAQPADTYNLAEGKIPHEGSPLGVLVIPSIHLDQVVVQGTSVNDLQRGPGHMPTSSLPGQRGNAVIAGRRATYGAPFGSIGSLRRGQTITVVDGLGTFHYRVVSVVYAESGRHDVVTQSADNRLTLVTAGSGYWPSGRLAVIAVLDGKPFPKLAATHFAAPASQLGLSGNAASGLLFVLWSLLFFVVLVAAVWLLRTWTQPVVVLLLGVPILLLIALFACEGFVGALPATV
jgi:sortase A